MVKQNQLNIWTYKPSTTDLAKLYVEKEDTFIELMSTDLTVDSWGDNIMMIVDNGRSFLRMTETDGWRHIYKVNIATGEKVLITPGDYDVASIAGNSEKDLYFLKYSSNYQLPSSG